VKRERITRVYVEVLLTSKEKEEMPILFDQCRFEEALLKDLPSNCKPVGLETMEQQMLANPMGRLNYPTLTPQEIVDMQFKSLKNPSPEGIAALKATKNNPDALRKLHFYRTGNILVDCTLNCAFALPELLYRINPGMRYQKAANRKLCRDMKNEFYYGRNEAWLDRVGYFNDPDLPPSLIAVGAAHLYGSRGLLSLLEKDGWTVEPYRGTKEEPFTWPVPAEILEPLV